MQMRTAPHPFGKAKAKLEPSHLTRGHELLRQQRWAEAAQALTRAKQSGPMNALDWLGLSAAHWRSGDVLASIEAARKCIDADPRLPNGYLVLTQGLLTMQQHAEAVEVCRRMPADAPRDQHFHVNYGLALMGIDDAQAAVGEFMQALGIQMDYELAYTSLGTAFKSLKLYEESVEAFRTAAALNPDNVLAHAFVAHMDQFACRWGQFEENRQNFLQALDRVGPDRISQGAEATPFALIPMAHSPQDFLISTRLEARRFVQGVKPMPAREEADDGRTRKLRIGYVSSDFHQHATALLITEMLEQRDTEHFEVTLYCHSRDDGSPVRERIKRSCDHFVEIHGLAPHLAARRIRDDGIDVLVDLKGYTNGNRFGIFAYRAAPVQVSFLGFPGTTGADYIDYVIGDPIVTPLEHAAHFSEKIAQMPVCYQPNDRQRPQPRASERAAWGLPDDAFVFASFNQCYKLTPEVFDVWMRLLHQVPGSVLWQLDGGEQSAANLRREAEARGIDPSRLIFAPPLTPDHHLSRLGVADLALDTWPCNAHTTASDALWAGLPLLTMQQTVFASRVASSLLNAVGLNDFVCTDASAYEARALELASAPEYLIEARQRLRLSIQEGPLFDSTRYARDLEALYRRMWERHAAGMPADHLPAV